MRTLISAVLFKAGAVMALKAGELCGHFLLPLFLVLDPKRSHHALCGADAKSLWSEPLARRIEQEEQVRVGKVAFSFSVKGTVFNSFFKGSDR